MAWITGHRDDQPRIQQGPSDPNAGMHAAFALIVGLAEREATGRGSLLEVTMVEGALNAACRAGAREDGVRQPARARREPQPERRAAGSVPRDATTRRGWRSRSTTDAQWRGLVDGARASRAGRPIPSSRPTPAGGRATTSSTSTSARGAPSTTSTPRPSCSSRTACPPRSDATRASMYDHPQLRARGFYEDDRPPGGRGAWRHRRGRSGSRPSTAGCARRRRPSASTTTRSSSTISASTRTPTSDSSTRRSSAIARSASDPPHRTCVGRVRHGPPNRHMLEGGVGLDRTRIASPA